MLTICRLVLLLTIATGCGDRSTASDRPALSSASALPIEARGDSLVEAAIRALADGRPWEATRLLQPVLADSVRRTPDVVLLAATAASDWGGWTEVVRLLTAERWLDTRFDGRGRVLLARAALEGAGGPPGAPARVTDSLAAMHAARALAAAPDDAERGLRETLLARADDRLDRLDSAALLYRAAAARLPDASDWLLLRAAGVTTDPGARAALYAKLTSATARSRIEPTEAQALERARDFVGAAAAYEKLRAPATALRLRLVTARDSAGRAAIRAALLTLVARRAGTADARLATEVLDRSFPGLTPAEQLSVARSAAITGPVSRAIAGFAATGSLGDADRMRYAAALETANREGDAAAQYAAVNASAALGARAAYLGARALLRAGDGAAARKALSDVRRAYAKDTAAAASALYLIGDLASDDGRDADARSSWLELARAYPTSEWAPAAAFRAAIVAYASGDVAAAARELDALRSAYPKSDDASAAAYWAGRAYAAAGDRATAAQRWRALVGDSTLSVAVPPGTTVAYYALYAARRMGIATAVPAATTMPTHDAVDAALRRAARLEQLGLDTEARLETEAIAREAITSPERLLATASGFHDRGIASRAIALGTRAMQSGASPSLQAYRLLYPFPQEAVIRAESRARGLDPLLVAAVIWQESRFTARATSPAGARGLMQVMPAVGTSIARAIKLPDWDPVLLYQPDVNVEIGTRHLAPSLARGGDPAYALAAYNAGQSRVTRWRAMAGTDDPELFVERIPFVETRDYVRIILGTRIVYGLLYGPAEESRER